MTTTRSQLKNNFLRKVIMRLDYQGVIDIVDTIKNLQLYIKNTGFVEMQEAYINDLEFQLNDPIAIANQKAIPITEISQIKTYKFRNEKRDAMLEINSLFCSLAIEVEEYRCYETYGPVLIEIFHRLAKNNPYINLQRIGFRKINDCIVRDYEKINLYFDSVFFPPVSNRFKLTGCNFIQTNCSYVDNFELDRYMINYTRSVTKGELNINDDVESAYQIAIDIDGYSNDKVWLDELLEDNQRLDLAFREINELLFGMYVETLTKEFVSSLENDSFNDNVIIGVRRNEF